METADRYRWEAQRLRELADLALSHVTKAELLNLGVQFDQLADLAERERGEDQPSASWIRCQPVTRAARRVPRSPHPPHTAIGLGALAHRIQCAPTARNTSGGRYHPE